MEITIKINGRMTVVEVSVEVAECMDAGRRKAENLSHERRANPKQVILSAPVSGVCAVISFSKNG